MLGMASPNNILCGHHKADAHPSAKDNNHNMGPTLMTSSELNALPKGPPPNAITLVGAGLGHI